MRGRRSSLTLSIARGFFRPIPVLVALALSATTGLAADQEPLAGAPAAREEVEVRLSTLEVFVKDRLGRPIYGLGASDFELLEDGSPAELAAFEAPSQPSVRTSRNSVQPVTAARHGTGSSLVLCVDSSFLVPGDLGRTIEPLRSFLDLTLRGANRAMLLDCHSEPEARVDLTSSVDSMTDGLADLSGALNTSRLSSEYRRILQEIEQIQGRGSPRMAPLNREAAPQLIRSRIDGFAEQANQEIASAADRLSRAVDAVEGLPGRVELLYLAGRPPQGSPSALYEAWKSAFGQSSGYTESILSAPGAELAEEGVGMFEFDSLKVRSSDAGEVEPFLGTARDAALRGVRIHSLEIGGLVSPSALLTTQSGGDSSLSGAGSGFSSSLNADQGLLDRRVLEELAEVTGGESLLATRDMSEELTRLSTLLDAPYKFVYRAGPRQEEGLHRLEVRLKTARSGTSLGYRRLHRVKTPDEIAGARAVSALLLTAGDNPLGVLLSARPPNPESRRRVKVPLTIDMPFSGLALLPRGRTHEGGLSIFLVFAGEDGHPSPIRKSVLPVKVQNSELLTSLGRRVEYSVELVVPSGTRRVAVGVRDDVADSISTAWVDLATDSKPQGRPTADSVP